jgi:putrescine transport system permease protein
MVRRSLLSTLKSWSQPRNFVIGVPYVWLLAFFAIPFVIVLKISFSWMQPIQPGYAPLIEWVEETRRLVVSFNFDNYRVLLRESLYVDTFLYSVKVAAVSTFWCLLTRSRARSRALEICC